MSGYGIGNMRNRNSLVVVIVVLLLRLGTAAVAAPTPSESPTECRGAALQSFHAVLAKLLTATTGVSTDPEARWSESPVFARWVKSPKSTLALVEMHLGCYPAASVDEIRLLSASLACLDLDDLLAYIKRRSLAPQSRPSEWALHYAVAPGPRWSTRLARQHADPRVQATLKEIMHSPNTSPGLQLIVAQILGGAAAAAAEQNPIKPLVTCSEGGKK